MQTNTKIMASGAVLCLSAMASCAYLSIALTDSLKNIDVPKTQQQKEDVKVVQRAMYYGSSASTCLGCLLILVGAFKKPSPSP